MTRPSRLERNGHRNEYWNRNWQRMWGGRGGQPGRHDGVGVRVGRLQRSLDGLVEAGRSLGGVGVGGRRGGRRRRSDGTGRRQRRRRHRLAGDARRRRRRRHWGGGAGRGGGGGGGGDAAAAVADGHEALRVDRLETLRRRPAEAAPGGGAAAHVRRKQVLDVLKNSHIVPQSFRLQKRVIKSLKTSCVPYKSIPTSNQNQNTAVERLVVTIETLHAVVVIRVALK